MQLTRSQSFNPTKANEVSVPCCWRFGKKRA